MIEVGNWVIYLTMHGVALAGKIVHEQTSRFANRQFLDRPAPSRTVIAAHEHSISLT